jgi:DNA-binding GntR family transcriptional regulator
MTENGPSDLLQLPEARSSTGDILNPNGRPDLPERAAPNRRLEVPSVVDLLYQAIRTDILQGRIDPQMRLTEVSVANSFSVARPTAKAALERLIYEGLLHRGRNKSARVPRLDRDDIRDLYTSRAYLERAAVAELAQISYVPSAALAAHQRFQAGIDASDMSSIVDADMELHGALLESLNSPRFSKMYQSILSEVRLCMAQVQARHLLARATVAKEHSDILAAIENGDAASAIAALDLHLNAACSTLVGRLET